MTTFALKENLLKRINLIEDDSVLVKIKNIIDKNDSKVYVLSDIYLDKLAKSREQFANGEFYTQEQVDSKIEKWFNEK